MPKSLVWRGFSLGALFLLFTAGVASSQMSPFPMQNNIAWGGPIQPPDVGSADNHSQPVIPLNQTPPDISADTPGQDPSGAPVEGPDGNATNNAASNTANNSASTISDNNTVRQLGTPFPLQLQPEGLKIGPFYLPSISDSFFYAVNNSPGEPTNTFVGNSISLSLVYSKPLSRGIFAFQAHEQFSVANSQHPYLNQSLGATFNEQLSERWSLSASAAFTYFQNSILANPQYLLAYNNGGLVQQTVFLQQQGTTVYESNNISLSYQMGSRTSISISPILGATFQYLQGGWSNVRQYGGGVSITQTLTPDLSVSGFYSLYYSSTSGAAASYPGWVNQNLGVSFQGTFVRYRGWSLGGSVAASTQRYTGSTVVTPTGTLRLLKSFGQSSISAAYTRTEASSVFISKGYFDQSDIGYNQKIGQKASFNLGVGLFRTSYTGSYYNGKRAGGSFIYQFSPRLSLNASYGYTHQNGVQTSSFSPFLGNTNFFNLGLTWFLGAHSGL